MLPRHIVDRRNWPTPVRSWPVAAGSGAHLNGRSDKDMDYVIENWGIGEDS